MTSNRIRLELLELATEDFYQLHEMVWRLRTVLPERSEEECRRLAVEHVEALLGEQYVRLFEREGAQGEEQPLAPEDARRVLRERHPWQPPRADQGQVVVAATPSGQRAYREQRRTAVKA